MVDDQFTEPSLAALYDYFCSWDLRGDFGFYLPLVMAANSVLDVGCGTGMLLRQARAQGHAGRLCGLDPAAAMLDVAPVAEEYAEADKASLVLHQLDEQIHHGAELGVLRDLYLHERA